MKPNTLLALRLNKTDTETLETSFFILPTRVDLSGNFAKWQPKLATLLMLLSGNLLSLPGNLTQTRQKRAFLYVFIMTNSPLPQRDVTRLFKDEMNGMFAASVESPPFPTSGNRENGSSRGARSGNATRGRGGGNT